MKGGWGWDGFLGRMRYSWRVPRRPRSIMGYVRLWWQDFIIHPFFEGTECCQDCGRLYPVWSAPDDLWALGMGFARPGAHLPGTVCPSCFDERCRDRGVIVEFTASVFRDRRNEQVRAMTAGGERR